MKRLPQEWTGIACSKTQSESLMDDVGIKVKLLPLNTAIFLQSLAVTREPLKSRELYQSLCDLT